MKDDSDSEIRHRDEPAGEENFLARWSRRKSAPRAAEDDARREAEATAPAAAGQPELTDADMPAIESLGEDSDYAAFMSPKVSEALRRQALHRLFHLPACNITDGLDDYDEDFTRFAGLGDVVTHEMKRMLLREAERADAGAGEGQEQAAGEVENASAADLPEPEDTAADASAEKSAPPAEKSAPDDAGQGSAGA